MQKMLYIKYIISVYVMCYILYINIFLKITNKTKNRLKKNDPTTPEKKKVPSIVGYEICLKGCYMSVRSKGVLEKGGGRAPSFLEDSEQLERRAI